MHSPLNQRNQGNKPKWRSCRYQGLCRILVMICYWWAREFGLNSEQSSSGWIFKRENRKERIGFVQTWERNLERSLRRGWNRIRINFCITFNTRIHAYHTIWYTVLPVVKMTNPKELTDSGERFWIRSSTNECVRERERNHGGEWVKHTAKQQCG